MGNNQEALTDPAGTSQGSPAKRRLFFALWPPQDVRKSMAELNRQLPPPERGGRLIESTNIHLTLYYIGPVVAEEIISLVDAAKAVESRPFKLELNRLGYFKRPRVLWLGCEERPAGYIELLRQLTEQIVACGFGKEVKENRPHVTLQRKVSRPKAWADIQTIGWDVEQFVLLESVSIKGGVSYQIVERYPLNAVD